MKAVRRILSLVLVLILLVSVTATAFAAFTPDASKVHMYKEQVFDALGWDVSEDEYGFYNYGYLFEYNADNSATSDEATPDYVAVHASYGLSSYEVTAETIGNYIVKSGSLHHPYKLGYHIYSTADREIYTLLEAYEADLPNVEFALSMLGEKEYMYRDVFKDYMDETYMEFFEYKELYSYYAENVTADEATPDYLLIYGHSAVAPSYSYGIFGDYIVHTDYFYPDDLPYYVITQKGTVLTLREAWDAQLGGIEEVFTDYGLGKMLGDMDGDRKLTVRDATYIQKCLAGLMEFPEEDEVRGIPVSYDDSPDENVRYISDFDGDDQRTVKDATAIQKKIAGIEDNKNHRPAFEYDCVLILSNKDYPILSVEDFPEYDFASVELTLYEDYTDLVIYELILSTPGEANVLEAVDALKYREGVDFETAMPNYLAYID